MKKAIAIGLMCFTLSLAIGAEVIEEISAGFKRGDYRVFAKYMADKITLNLPGNEGVFSKAQAEQILRDFFFKNPSRDFTVSHQGESKDGTKYFIGNLTSANSGYRAYCHLKKQGDAFKIHELRLEKE